MEDAPIPFTASSDSWYWQSEIPEADRNEIIFSSSPGLFRFVRISFGPQNARAFFQQVIGIMLLAARCQLALVFLNDFHRLLEVRNGAYRTYAQRTSATTQRSSRNGAVEVLLL